MKIALFIGRFQPFHRGHLSVVEKVLKENDFCVIGIGSSEDNYLPKNPFTASERWQMIRLALDEIGLSHNRYTIIPVRNINNYAIWVNHIEKILPPFEDVYTGSKIVKKLFEDHGKHKVINVEFTLKMDATQIREAMKKGKAWEDYVPPAVATFLKEIKAEKRLKTI